MSLDIIKGSFGPILVDSNNKSYSIFTSSIDGKQYYVPASLDSCGTQALTGTQTCNTQFCNWNDTWQDMIDSTGKSSCAFPCSNYMYQQYDTCSGSKCDSGDGKTGATMRYKLVPCGNQRCATKNLSSWGAWNACSKTCGGGNQSQSRSCSITPITSPTYPTGTYITPLKTIPQPTIPTSNFTSSFNGNNMYDSDRYY